MLSPGSRGFVTLLGALTGLTALSIDMSLPALPTLALLFQAKPETVALTLSVFLLGYSVGQLAYGPLADRFGRRPLILAGLLLYVLAGLGCIVSGSIGQLVAFRLMQGVGACSGPILARAIVRDLFERPRAAQILSYMTLVMSAAPLLAPIIGGYLLLLHWRAIFGLLTAVGIIVLIATWLGLAESIPRRNPRATHPAELSRNLLDFLRRRQCIGYALLVCFASCGLFSYISGSPFVLIEVYGVPSDLFGYLFGLNAISLMIGASANGRLVRRVGSNAMLRAGIAFMLLGGAAMLIAASFPQSGPLGIALSMVVYMIGFAIVIPNGIATAMEPVPHMAGFASSLIGCLQTAGGSVMSYVLGAIYDRSGLPMAGAVALSALLAAGLYFLFLGPRARPADLPGR